MKGFPTTSIYFDTRFKLKGKKYPVKLQVHYQGVQKFYSIRDLEKRKITLTQEEYFKTFSSKTRGECKEMGIYLKMMENRALEIIRELPFFNFETFEYKYFNVTESKNLLILLQLRADKLKMEGRISTGISFNCTTSSLKKFCDSDNLPLENVDVKLLQNYEDWMVKNGRSLTSVGIYIRNVRTIYNECISKRFIKQEFYPFGRRKYQIPVGKNVKIDLPKKDLKLLASFPVTVGSNVSLHQTTIPQPVYFSHFE